MDQSASCTAILAVRQAWFNVRCVCDDVCDKVAGKKVSIDAATIILFQNWRIFQYFMQ